MDKKEYRGLKKKFMEVYQVHKKNDNLLDKLFPRFVGDFQGNMHLISWDSAYEYVKKDMPIATVILWQMKRDGVI